MSFRLPIYIYICAHTYSSDERERAGDVGFKFIHYHQMIIMANIGWELQQAIAYIDT